MPPVASEAQTEAEAVLPAAEPANDAAPANLSASSSPADESGAGTQALGKDDGLQRLLGRRLKKKKRNETHEKDSVYIRKDLKERLAKLAANHGKGFRTLLLNYGLEKALDELEQADAALRQGEQL
ncbi:hypothetical protein [Paenibacillus validus]|uniref:Uncharacterized protein n=1 Tax=Paenibacillus validus TaxID=44253 RepID=A0A7X3CSD7_9BACL|nr:hypothetical protein [Paenibacillus validus]MUG71212.1 hypothetical protein [Paenibacillus validus]